MGQEPIRGQKGAGLLELALASHERRRLDGEIRPIERLEGRESVVPSW